jgi:hypothetical protein
LVTTNPLPEDLTLKIRELESEVTELKTHIEALTKFAKAHSKYWGIAIGHVLEGMSIMRYYANREGPLGIDEIEGAFESIGELQHLHESCNYLDIRDEIEDYMGNLMSCVIELCGDARIGSAQLLQTLKQRFDRGTLLKIVNLKDVADSYGLAEAHEWWHRLRS